MISVIESTVFTGIAWAGGQIWRYISKSNWGVEEERRCIYRNTRFKQDECWIITLNFKDPRSVTTIMVCMARSVFLLLLSHLLACSGPSTATSPNERHWEHLNGRRAMHLHPSIRLLPCSRPEEASGFVVEACRGNEDWYLLQSHAICAECN